MRRLARAFTPHGLARLLCARARSGLFSWRVAAARGRQRRAPPQRTAIALAGHYRTAHEIRMVCDGDQRQDADGWCKETVEDTLRIRELANGNIEVAIELVSTNAHTCSFEGTLERTLDSQSARRWRFDAENDEEFPCSLVVEHARRRLTVTSDGCREYCGARATLDAVFDVRPRS